MLKCGDEDTANLWMKVSSTANIWLKHKPLLNKNITASTVKHGSGSLMLWGADYRAFLLKG